MSTSTSGQHQIISRRAKFGRANRSWIQAWGSAAGFAGTPRSPAGCRIVGAIARPPRYLEDACRQWISLAKWRHDDWSRPHRLSFQRPARQADVWPFAVKMFVRPRRHHSFPDGGPIPSTFRIAIDPTRVEHFGCGTFVLHKIWANKSWTGQDRELRDSCWASGSVPGAILQSSWLTSHSWSSTRFAKSEVEVRIRDVEP